MWNILRRKINGEMAEWSIAPDLKSGNLKGFVGSNPGPLPINDG